MSYEVTEQDERIGREETQKKISAIVPRELLPNGSYAPVPGIFDIAWKGLLDLPAYDFVRSMRELDNSIIKENEEWALRLAPMCIRGELTIEQIKQHELFTFKFTDAFPISIARNVFENVRNREVRDLILRHANEEMGHSELQVDFLERGLGITRQEVYDSAPLVSATAPNAGSSDHKAGFFGADTEEMIALRKESPELAYALVPFQERVVPKQMRLMGRALREKYGFKDEHALGFFDLHSYIDIYHERFGVYIMAKYGTNKRSQELFRAALEDRRRVLVNSHRSAYYAVKGK